MYREGSRWFRRFLKDCKRISPHIKVVRIKYGFYRIYWRNAYLGEAYKEMPQFGYEIEEKNLQLTSQKYYEEYEDRAEYIRKIKNFKEGYWESLDRLLTKAWLMRHNDDYHQKAVQAYKQHVIK